MKAQAKVIGLNELHIQVSTMPRNRTWGFACELTAEWLVKACEKDAPTLESLAGGGKFYYPVTLLVVNGWPSIAYKGVDGVVAAGELEQFIRAVIGPFKYRVMPCQACGELNGSLHIQVPGKPPFNRDWGMCLDIQKLPPTVEGKVKSLSTGAEKYLAGTVTVIDELICFRFGNESYCPGALALDMRTWLMTLCKEV